MLAAVACGRQSADDGVECAPVVTAGVGGAIPSLDSIPASQPVSALLVWRSGVPRGAERSVRAAGGQVAHAFGAQPALLVSATGVQLRRLRGEHPDADVALPLSGTVQLCVVGEHVVPVRDRITEAKRSAQALARRVLRGG